MTKLFVIGATGYVGTNFIRAAALKGHWDVVTVGRQGCDIYLDLATDHFGELMERVHSGDGVLLLASISSPDQCQKKSRTARRVNVVNTINLIEKLVSKGVRVVFASTDAVFGGTTGSCTDDQIQCPAGIYGQTKAAVELAFMDEPLTTVARFSYVVGAGDKYTDMLRNACNSGEEIEVFEGFKRNIVSIDDVTDGLCSLYDDWEKFAGERINFSGPELIGRDQLTAALADTAMSRLAYKVVQAPSGFWDSRSKVINTHNEKFSELLGKPAKGLKQIVEEWK